MLVWDGGGSTVTTNLLMETAFSGIAVPTDPTDINNRVNIWQYYTINDYGQFISMVNTALQTCFNSLKNANPSMLPNAPPYLMFNSTTKLITIIDEQNYVDPIGGETRLWFLMIYMN